MVDSFSDSLLGEPEFNSDDLFKILESLEDVTQSSPEKGEEAAATNLVSQKSSAAKKDSSSFASKKRKRNNCSAENSLDGDGKKDGHEIKNASHITVERNRRKQMNEHLAVLRSLMPCFYVKRGDQASIIGGVVDYISELQQVLQSLEAKKQRKVYSEVLSPRVVVSSPRLLAPSSPLISPKKPPLSPRLNFPISPRTPQPTSPYKPRFLQQTGHLSPTTLASPSVITSSFDSSSNLSTSFSNDVVNSISVNTMGGNELVASSKSSVADVEVKFCGANLLLNTVSQRIPRQAAKIISVLEGLSLEILQVSINSIDETMLNSFTIKIGIECQLSAEELAHEIQQTF